MKKSIFVILAVFAIIAVSTSCESKSGKRVIEMKNSQLKTEKAPTQEALLFSPEKIGVTKLVEEFIPYPNYDGGTGIKINFSIGAQYKGKIYEVQCSEGKFLRDNVTKEEAMKDQRLVLIKWAHTILEMIPVSRVSIVAVNGEIIKISSTPTFGDNGEFTPSQVIWEKNN